MSDEVYALRRNVINFIYEAATLLGRAGMQNLPRIDVRVTDDHAKILGVAVMGGNVIWITERAVVSRATVFHEILHAVKGQKHVTGCPLMNPAIHPNLDKETCERLFLHYMGK